MKQRLYILKYECNEATAMLQRLYIVNYECNEATVLLHRLDKKPIKHKFSLSRLPTYHNSQDKDPNLLNNTHTCTSFPRNFCMDFQEHFFPFLLQSSACTRGFLYIGVSWGCWTVLGRLRGVSGTILPSISLNFRKSQIRSLTFSNWPEGLRCLKYQNVPTLRSFWPIGNHRERFQSWDIRVYFLTVPDDHTVVGS